MKPFYVSTPSDEQRDMARFRKFFGIQRSVGAPAFADFIAGIGATADTCPLSSASTPNPGTAAEQAIGRD